MNLPSIARLCIWAAMSLAAIVPAAAHDKHEHMQGPKSSPPGEVTVRGLDTTLVNQDGRSLHLRRDVIGSKIVVVDFVYTSCTTVCPVASAMFQELQSQLGEQLGREVELVTITVDPVRDTPARLKAFAEKFQARPGWTWLTGSPIAVNDVLKGMGAYAADFTQHPLMTLVGDGTSGQWLRFAGLPEPRRLAEHVRHVAQSRAEQVGQVPRAAKIVLNSESKARDYFTDSVLQAQDGRSMRFFSDVLKDRVVLVNFVFTECGDSCPLITHKLLQARQALGAQAPAVRFVSITIDPERETPQSMAAFAKKHSAVDAEWLWLSGSKSNIELVTRRLGAYTDAREDHFTGLIVGNLRTDRWVKIRPDAPPQVIAEQLRRVGELEMRIGAADTRTP